MSNDWKNKLYYGDNLDNLRKYIRDETIDLCYIDPPFNSKRNYNQIYNNFGEEDKAQAQVFIDTWIWDTRADEGLAEILSNYNGIFTKQSIELIIGLEKVLSKGSLLAYLVSMTLRIAEIFRVLKSTGSFYLHCDWHASHYLKVMCDNIFGYNKLRNEIIWCYRGGGSPKYDFSRRHDTIFRYSKGNKYTFNIDEIRIPYSQDSIDRLKYKARAFRKNKIYDNYEQNILGKHPEDWWEMQPIMPSSKERLGYPTQKPESLLERIIKASSNKNDIVLDAFCGCGTALAVSEKLGRKWIGIDISPSAIALIKKRLSLIPGFIANYDTIGMPQRVEDLKDFKPYEFQYWVINEMYGMPSPRKSGDMGIDGLSFLEHCPIQVKQSESIGRNVIDNFETVLQRYYKNSAKIKKGYIVAFSFGKGAKEEVVRIRQENIDIHLITVEDILNKKFTITKQFDIGI